MHKRKRFESTRRTPCHRLTVTSTTTYYTSHDDHSRDPHGHPSARTSTHPHTIIVKLLLPFVRVCLNSHHAEMKKHCTAITMRSTPFESIAKKKTESSATSSFSISRELTFHDTVPPRNSITIQYQSLRCDDKKKKLILFQLAKDTSWAICRSAE